MAKVQWVCRVAACAMLALPLTAAVSGAARAADDAPVRIVALGDSLTAGFGLPANQAFPEKLARALTARGIKVAMTNAGVSGDTSSGGLGRLDWSLPDNTEAVILELGANDALRGIDPAVTAKSLDAILSRLQARKIPVLLCGMRAPPNMGAQYTTAFDGLFADLAARYGPVFYPFFLDGVAADPRLNQADGIHPNPDGVDVIVMRIMPKIEDLIARVRAARGS